MGLYPQIPDFKGSNQKQAPAGYQTHHRERISREQAYAAGNSALKAQRVSAAPKPGWMNPGSPAGVNSNLNPKQNWAQKAVAKFRGK